MNHKTKSLVSEANIFDFRDRLIKDYTQYITSFIQIRDPKIREYVQRELNAGVLWPEPLIQLNPSFQPGEWIEELVQQRIIHDECSRIFRLKPQGFDTPSALNPAPNDDGHPLRLY